MSTAPARAVIDAIESGQSTITRRVEIYEADGVTLWNPDPANDPDFERLIDGSISVDSTRDERRTLDLTLRNDDKLLRPNPNGGFWYDKVIKCFRGVTYAVAAIPPKIAIVAVSDTGSAPYQFRSLLNGLGMTRTDVRLDAVTADDVADYDILLVWNRNTANAKAQMLADFYNSGGSVVSMGVAETAATLPFVTATASSGATAYAWGITPVTADTPFTGVFTQETATTNYTGQMITGVDTSVTTVATWTNAVQTNFRSGVIAQNPVGGRWFHLHLPHANGLQAKALLKAGIVWVWNYQSTASWEIQMGEFLIDSIAEDSFPHQIKLTGRDYTKKCLLSKLGNAQTYRKGTKVRDLIIALAANSGITKMRLPAMDETLAADLSMDRGTDRWTVIKQASDSNGYEVYFDNQGYLVARKYQDPSLSPVNMTFKTGPDGNLVSFTRSLNDSRLYNHVIVWGDPADGDESRLPYFGDAKNTEPSSPTRINRIGDRVYTYATTFVNSDQQAKDFALTMLKVHALESYELEFGSIYYPWLEAGEISTIEDPDATEIDPDRFLVDTLTYSMGLGAMSATGKRVTYVGDPGSAVTTDDNASG